MVGKTSTCRRSPQWYGETIGFWDGTTLVTWTANIQAWQLSHAMFETSDKLETVETFKPALDAGGKFIGLDHETIFYDPDAFVAAGARLVPLRAGARRRTIPNRRYTFIECLSNIFNTDGRPKQVTTPTRASSTTTAGRGPRTGRSTSRPAGTSRRRSSRRPSPISLNSAMARYSSIVVSVEETMTTRTVKASTMAAWLAVAGGAVRDPGLDAPFVRDVRPEQGRDADRRRQAVRAPGQPRRAPLHAARAGPQGAGQGRGREVRRVGRRDGGHRRSSSGRGSPPTTFGAGTVFSVKLNPLRDGSNFGARVGAIAKCPVDPATKKPKLPEPGKHCDSVAGHTLIGGTTF